MNAFILRAYGNSARVPCARALVLFLIVLLAGCGNDNTDIKPAGQEKDDNFDYAEGQGKPPEGVKIDTAAFEKVLRMDTTRDGRTVAQRISDASTAARVRSALVEERSLRAFDFQPVVLNGIVRLAGEVQTPDQRSRAEQVAKGTEGVRAVLNAVAVKEAPPPPPGLTKKPLATPTPAHDRTTSKAPATNPGVTAAKPQTPATTSKPPAAKPKATEKSKEKTTYYTVRKGDSYAKIARRYGVSVAQLQRLNRGKSTLHPGQRVRVK